MDEFPEIFKTTNNSSRDIDHDIDEGLIESTHFILSYKNGNYNLAFEFNQYGARFSDFVYYVSTLGFKLKILEELNTMNIVTENIEQRKSKIGPIGSVLVKVHKSKIKVELKHQSKSLVSSDMLNKMNKEMINKLNL